MKALQISVIRSHSDKLTKTLRMVNGKIVSDAPSLYRGMAYRKSLYLKELPDLISNLSKTECLATGWQNTHHKEVEILTKTEFENRGFEFPVYEDETGIYGTRTKASVVQKGSSLIMLDYDPDPQSPFKVASPEEFLVLLDKAMPEMNFLSTSYVRDYSTSTALYDKATGKEIRKPEGFHIYMQVDKGENLEIFAEHLEYALWRNGLGYIKIGSSSNRLIRTIIDLAVLTPERIIFAAGAHIPEGESFYQELPKPEFNDRENSELKLKDLKPLTPKQKADLIQIQNAAKQSKEVIERVNEKRKQLEIKLISQNHYTSRPLTPAEAKHTVEALGNYILRPDHLLYFENGETVEVLEVLKNPLNYDGMAVLDPLRPDKGFGKAMFYANATTQTPVINSFVEGGRIFNLIDTYNEFVRIRDVVESDLELLVRNPVLLEDRYFPKIQLKEGITLIKGEKGTGKTTAVANHIKQCEGRVLAISHRISLVNALCRSFKLTSYNNFRGKNQHLIRPEPRLGICYNSLHRLSGIRYDYVIIDEFVQLVRTIKSKILNHRFVCLNVLRSIIKSAKYVILMDADLSKSLIDFVSTGEHSLFSEEQTFNLYINQYKPAKGRQITIYQDTSGIQPKPDRPSFVLEYHKALREGGLFYASNSRSNILLMASEAIDQLGGSPQIEEDHFITEIDGRRVITITAKNSQYPEVQEFITNINECLTSEDIFLSSPSLGTGVSIDSKDGKPKFQRVFGFFTKRASNLPSDCLQHMARVRDCNQYDVLISNYYSQLETDPIKIINVEVLGKKGLMDQHLMELATFDWETGSITFNDYGWTTYYGELTARENEGRNDFYKLLIDQMYIEGYQINSVSNLDAKVKTELNNYEKALKLELKTLEIKALIDTPLISDEEYEELQNQLVTTVEDQRKILKKNLANLFGFSKTTSDFIELLSSSNQVIRGRSNSLILGADPQHLAVLDIAARVNKKQHAYYLKALYDKQQFLFNFLELLKITKNEDGELEHDEELLTEYELYLAYEYLYENALTIKVLFGTDIAEVSSPKEMKQEVTKGLKWLGLGWERGSRVLIPYKGIRKRGISVSSETVKRLQKDLKRARNYSKSFMFTELTAVPESLREYGYSLYVGQNEYKFNTYFNNLEPKYKNLIDTKLLELIQKGMKRAA